MSASVGIPFKFGILGCANVAEKFCQSVTDSGEAVIYAVGSRSIEKAKAFAEKNCPGAKVYDSYDAVLEDEDIDAVYIPLPTGIRAEWAVKAARRKLHVLTEKPVGLTAAEATQVVRECNMAGVQYMDNTMWMHHERTSHMKNILNSPDFGAVKMVTSCFSVDITGVLNSNIRSQKSTEPLGCLGDLGWYNVGFTLWAYNYDMPLSVSCHVHDKTADGVPIALTATLRFSEGRTATFNCSFGLQLRQWAEVVGKNQVLSVDDFVVTQQDHALYKVCSASIAEKALYFPKAVHMEPRIIDRISQNAKLVAKFVELAKSGQADEFWPNIAVQTQTVVDALMLSGQYDGVWVDVGKGPGTARSCGSDCTVS